MTSTSETASALFGRRVLAFAVDLALALTPLWFLLPVALSMNSHPGATDQLTARALLILAPFPSLVLYFGVQLIQLARGRPTIGRRLARIEVVPTREGDSRVAMAARREILGIFLPLSIICVTGLFPAALILALWTLVDPGRRSLPDVVAGSHVVELDPGKIGRQMPWETSPSE